MKHMKTSYSVSLNYPVYIQVPDSFDDPEDVATLIEDELRGPRGWDFGEDAVYKVVESALPFAEEVQIDVNDLDLLTDDAPRGAIVYDLEELVPKPAIKNFLIGKSIDELAQAAGDAAYSGDITKLLQVVAEIQKLHETMDE